MAIDTKPRDPERIYLEPWPYSPEGRLWSAENVWPLYTWPPEPEDESPRALGVEYIRADLHAAEIARLTREMEAARERERAVRDEATGYLAEVAGTLADMHDGDECRFEGGDGCLACYAQGRIAEMQNALAARTTGEER